MTKEQEIENIRAHYDLLLPESGGYIEPDEYEKTYQISQKEIASSVDITSATKYFDLKLNYGPYCVNYYRNGRQMLIGGNRGHVASMDWITKKLICEFNVMETISDIKWLHMPLLFAVAQRDWVYIYDNKGVEMHCLKRLYKIKKMEYLPYHFLLATASENGHLTWTDTSTGTMISQFRPKKVRRIMCMTSNPSNGVILTGHSNGTVNMWTPNSNDPAISMLCHNGAMRDVGVTLAGNRMATIGSDKNFKLWDIRMLKPMKSYRLKAVGECLDISQRDMIAIGTGNIVQVFKNCWIPDVTDPYIQHKCPGFVKNVQFCAFEDVLGIGHENGFTSVLVPGAGEPNFDSFEANPFMTTSQRKEMEIKMLLDKIPPELINIDPDILGKVNVQELRASLEAKKKLKYVKVPKIVLNEKKTMSSVDKFKLKKRLNDDARRKQVRAIIDEKVKDKRKMKEDTKTIKRKPIKGKPIKGKPVRGKTFKSKGNRAVSRFLVKKGLKRGRKSNKSNFSKILDRFKSKGKK